MTLLKALKAARVNAEFSQLAMVVYKTNDGEYTFVAEKYLEDRRLEDILVLPGGMTFQERHSHE
jgi:hypothetical protein